MAAEPWIKMSVMALLAINLLLIIGVLVLFAEEPEVTTAAAVAPASTAPGIVISSSSTPSDGFTYGGVLNEGRGEWVAKKPLTVARSDVTAVVCSGKTFVIGGGDANGAALDLVLEYDAVFETETVKAPLPVGRTRFAAGCVDNKIIVAGGFLTGSADGNMEASSVIYDVAADSWTAGPALNNPRSDFAGATVNGKFYVFHGYNGESYDFVDSVEVYDPVANSWTVASATPSVQRGDVSTTVSPDGSKIFIVGGWGGANYDFVHDVEVYDPVADSFSSVAPIPAARGDMSTVTHNNKVHVIGGEIWSGEQGPCGYDPTATCNINEIPTHDHFVYDAVSDVWTKAAPIPTSRFRFTSVSANGAIFVFGGHSEGTNVVDEVEAFYNVDQEPLYYHFKEEDSVVQDRLRH